MRFRALVSLLLAALVCRADRVEQGVKDAAPSGLMAGVARADITPPVGIPQMNWGAQRHVTASGIDPAGMLATALVISDGKQKFAMVDIDALSVGRMDAAIARASALTGIPASHIRLGATHTHAGPVLTGVKGPVGMDLTQFQEGFNRHWAVVADKIVGAIAEANSRLVPVHVGAAKGIGTINANRRMGPRDGKPPAVGLNPDGALDRDLNVIRIDDAKGNPLAVILNYQCHGTVMAWENEKISPDWPGMTRKVVEQALPGALCLFFQGAAGNQGPMEGFTGDLAVAHRLGSILGHQASALALQIETVKRAPQFEGYVESTAYIARQPWRVSGPRDGTLKFASAVLDLPGREYTPAEVDRMRREVREAESRVAQLKPDSDPIERHVAEARLRRFKDLLEQWQQPSSGQPVKVRVQALRIGETVIVAMPGEPFAEIGMAVKKASPFPVTLFCGYSNGEGGDYMPLQPDYDMQGYEVDRTPYGRGAAEKLIRETVALLKSVQ
jgi:hypothetical protein